VGVEKYASVLEAERLNLGKGPIVAGERDKRKWQRGCGVGSVGVKWRCKIMGSVLPYAKVPSPIGLVGIAEGVYWYHRTLGGVEVSRREKEIPPGGIEEGIGGSGKGRGEGNVRPKMENRESP